MPKSLTLFHTAGVHVETFNTLLTDLAADIPVQHVVDEALLEEAVAAGALTPDLQAKASKALLAAAQNEDGVVLCTCSTIGICAEFAGKETGHTILRVDKPMAEKAIALGQRIGVAATLPSTLEPTKRLLRETAKTLQRQIELVEILCQTAWPKFEAGDTEGYLKEIAQSLEEVATTVDVIVLAQASMAGAAQFLPDMITPILSSPRLGLEAAIAACREDD